MFKMVLHVLFIGWLDRDLEPGGGGTSPEANSLGQLEGIFLEETVRRAWHPGAREACAHLPSLLMGAYSRESSPALREPSTLFSQMLRFFSLSIETTASP